MYKGNKENSNTFKTKTKNNRNTTLSLIQERA